jgi:hypothetical protein
MLVQPMYKELTADGIKKWELGAQQNPSPFASLYLSLMEDLKVDPFPHTHDIRKPTDRWQYGMHGMGYDQSSWDPSRPTQTNDMLHLRIGQEYLNGEAFAKHKYW